MLKHKSLVSIIALCLISALVYRVWLSFSIFTFGDWQFAFNETLREYIYPSAWGIHGLALDWQYPLLLIYGLIAQIGASFNVVEKIANFWPIIFITPVSSFLLIKKILHSDIAGFVGALFFIFNTYFLSIDTQGHELLTVAFAFAPFAILSFINLLENKKPFWIPLSVLSLFAVGIFDPRSMYVTSGVLFIYFIYHQLVIENNFRANLAKNISYFLSVFVLFGLLNIFWVLPSLISHSLTNNEYLTRQIFGTDFYNLQSSINSFYPFWSGKEPTWFQVQKIPFYFWLYPTLAFVGLILGKKNKALGFFAVLSLLGIFLGKQEAAPFNFVYPWLYGHLPGFAAFREASKFDFLVDIGFAVMIGSVVSYIWNSAAEKKRKYIIVFALALLPFINTVPLLTGEINTLFVAKHMSADYIKLKDYIVKDPNYSRVFGINLNQRYNFTTVNHPTMDALYSLQNFWGNRIDLYNSQDTSQTQGAKIVDYLNSETGRRLLDSSSVGYVPVFVEDKETNQSIRRDLGEDGSFFEQNLDESSYLKKVNIGMKNILLYKNTDVRPHIYLTVGPESLSDDVAYEKVGFQTLGQSEYRVSVKDISKPFYLNFTEQFDPGWKVYTGKFNWWSALIGKQKSLPESSHVANALNFNAFRINPAQVCGNSKCLKNPNGSYSFDLTVYFLPQAYMNLGLIVSGSVLILTIGSALYFIRKEKYEKT